MHFGNFFLGAAHLIKFGERDDLAHECHLMAGTPDVSSDNIFDFLDSPQATRINSPKSETRSQEIEEVVLEKEVLEKFSPKFQNSTLLLTLFAD